MNKFELVKKQLGHLFFLLFNAKKYGFIVEEKKIISDIQYYVYFYYALKNNKCEIEIDNSCIIEKYKCICNAINENENINMDNEQLNELILAKIEELIPCFDGLCDRITAIEAADCCEDLTTLAGRVTVLENAEDCCDELSAIEGRVTSAEADIIALEARDSICGIAGASFAVGEQTVDINFTQLVDINGCITYQMVAIVNP